MAVISPLEGNRRLGTEFEGDVFSFSLFSLKNKYLTFAQDDAQKIIHGCIILFSVLQFSFLPGE